MIRNIQLTYKVVVNDGKTVFSSKKAHVKNQSDVGYTFWSDGKQERLQQKRYELWKT